jgi:transcriptional regulator with XRE-family HTH domain
MSIKNLTEFSERIKAVREATGLNRGDFGKSLSVSGAYIGQLENGARTNPSPHFLNSVEKRYKINLNWLESGAGEMRDNQPYISAEEHLNLGKTIDPISEKINIMLAGMTDKQRRDVLKYVEEKKLLSELIEDKKRKAG